MAARESSVAGFPVVNGVTVFIPPPEGYIVDFSNPRRQSALEHYLVAGILGPIALVALCQRIYTKIYLGAGFKVDDWFMCIAWAFSVVMQSTQIYSISIGGLCHHTWEMSIETFEKSLMVSYVAATAFILCNGFTKTSILLYYRGISPRAWFQRAIWAACGMVGCYTIIIACMLLFGCDPIDSFWVPELLGTGRCLDSNVLYMAIAVSNIVSDCVLFIIPIPTILRLRMRLAQKLGAMVIFGIASLTLITSVVRLQLLPTLLTSKDISWDAGPANVWSILEANLFIICGSMPTLRKFAIHFWPSIMGDSSKDGGASDQRGQSGHAEDSSPSKYVGGRNPYTRFDLETHSGAELTSFGVAPAEESGRPAGPQQQQHTYGLRESVG
ncbi:hypothetical protein GGTG_10975 [Gaeumannomyces tritici R3-111a-1]|uniref:Rhodopsin domain-containing protein n=1 Tax=Gaeumannomyces tritici (strain R3-111a-1) TaxID=644352 RepID=J3PBV3_GAET3|nr:hypothetical protein GGTG_10975 [Gaeumannomyces tritici R3-111a-1]EJT71721.1 hypothetical protein GGTG_10975 [Gaeumannomyces tritici R3-111a-1]